MLTAEQIVSRVRDAGIIGAGGGGFPTHVKLQAKNIDVVIANGSECEPLLCSDYTMMIKTPRLLLTGLQLAMQAVGATQGVVALKAHYHEAIVALQKELIDFKNIRLHLLDNYYPAGDEFLLVYEVTGKVIPEGGLPLNVGTVVSNVVTLMQVAESVAGKPVTERAVTLVGEFNKPQVVVAPIGATYEDLVKIAGGTTSAEVVLIDGGPMMGKIVADWSQGIAKTTSGILALPKEHLIVTMQQKTLGQMIKQSKSACCQCMRCSDLCPRNLIGHEIYPHMTMRTIDYNMAEPARHVTSAFLCSQCGVCELLACDFMLLSPRKIYAAYRKELVARGVANPHRRTDVKVRSGFSDAKLAIPTVMKKLALTHYDIDLPFAGLVAVNKVRIALNRHVGVAANVTVKVGNKVRRTDVIAATPADKLGAVYHASLDGTVTAIEDGYVEIVKN